MNTPPVPIHLNCDKKRVSACAGVVQPLPPHVLSLVHCGSPFLVMLLHFFVGRQQLFVFSDKDYFIIQLLGRKLKISPLHHDTLHI